MKPVLLALMAYLLLSSTPHATAQHDRKPGDRNPNKPNREEVRELRQQLRDWFQSDVKPTLLEWKAQYDASLSAEDLATLNQLRAEAKEHKKLLAKNHRKHPEHADDARRAKHDSMHAARKAFMERLKPILERSKDDLKTILENGKDELQTWKKASREIIDAWFTAHPDAPAHLRRHLGNRLPGMSGGGEGDKHDGKGDVRRRVVKFVLWDGTMPEEMEAEFGAAPTGLHEEHAALSSPLLGSPLPAENTINMSMRDLPNGPATLEIFNMEGTLMKAVSVSVANNALDQLIDVSMLPPGSYMASVNTTNGRRTTQIIVSR